MRIRSIVFVSVAVGLVVAMMSSSKSTFTTVFLAVFWGGGVGVVLLLARLGQGGSETENIPKPMDIGDEQDPWVDEMGVRHFPNDVFDPERDLYPRGHSRF